MSGDYDPLAEHYVEGRVELSVRLEPQRQALPKGRFSNVLSRASLQRIGTVVEVASSLTQPLTTADVIGRANASPDQKGTLGALRMLDVEGVVHARGGARRQLVWHPGPRAVEDERAAAQLYRYRALRQLLVNASDTWISTDYLLRTATFDSDLRSGPRDDDFGGPWRFSDLPVNFFVDSGKSGRKYLLGALKALYWRELVAWRLYSSQAVTWRWIGPAGKQRGLDHIIRWDPSLRPDDPYLTDGPTNRGERIDEKARDRAMEHEKRFQRWIEEHFPEAAQRYKDTQRTREFEREKRRRAEQREAATWAGDPTRARDS